MFIDSLVHFGFAADFARLQDTHATVPISYAEARSLRNIFDPRPITPYLGCASGGEQLRRSRSSALAPSRVRLSTRKAPPFDSSFSDALAALFAPIPLGWAGTGTLVLPVLLWLRRVVSPNRSR